MSFRVAMEFTRGAPANARAFGRGLRRSVGIAHPLAGAVRDRVQKLARPAQPPPAHDGRGLKLVSPRYPVPPARPAAPSGAEVFESPDEFRRQARARDAAFSVSGGMWGGLTVIVGSRRATIRFRGRSEGQEPVFRQRAAGDVVAKGRKIPNALKAATILRSMRINVLALTVGELQSIARAAVAVSVQSLPSLAGIRIDWRDVAADPLSRRMAAAVFALR